MVTVARLIFERNRKNNNQFNLEDRYKEMQKMAINDELTCEFES